MHRRGEAFALVDSLALMIRANASPQRGPTNPTSAGRVRPIHSKHNMNEQENIITIAGVERTFALYERKVKALRGVDMEVPRGAFVVLMGPSGSGKTTL